MYMYIIPNTKMVFAPVHLFIVPDTRTSLRILDLEL